MNEIWKLLLEKGYEIHNKRVLGNPSYTSKETRLRDIIQEQALVCYWLRMKHSIHLELYFGSRNGHGEFGHFAVKVYRAVNGLQKFINEPDLVKNKEWIHNYTPEEAIEQGIIYSLKNLIK